MSRPKARRCCCSGQGRDLGGISGDLRSADGTGGNTGAGAVEDRCEGAQRGGRGEGCVGCAGEGMDGLEWPREIEGSMIVRHGGSGEVDGKRGSRKAEAQCPPRIYDRRDSAMSAGMRASTPMIPSAESVGRRGRGYAGAWRSPAWLLFGRRLNVHLPELRGALNRDFRRGSSLKLALGS
jgi:hypothetical protein